MKTATEHSNEVGVCRVEGRLFIQVPWSQADRFRDHFRTLGISSTLHLDPSNHEARLEPWTNLSPERVVQLLRF
jgi:hypothetical protein